VPAALSQVLISIQAQILTDAPFYNEPSFEQYAGTDQGRRSVAKHNAMIRLATLRFGMLEPLRKAPAFFERAVAAHFYYKREELLKQAAQWVAEAKAMAVYEGVLRANHDATKAAYTARLAEEVKAYKDAHPELEKEEEERKKKAATAAGGSSSGSYSSLYHNSAYYGAAYGAAYGGGYPYYSYPSSSALGGGTWDSASSTVLPKGFKQSAALSAASAAHQTARTAYTTWATQTAVMSHQVFARGIASLPRAPFATYIPELAASAAAASAASSSSAGSSSSAAAAGASSSSSLYGAAPASASAPAPGTGAMQPSYGVDMVSIAAATESAAQELAAALAKLSPPEALDEDLGGL
jgi:hypothetical protein